MNVALLTNYNIVHKRTTALKVLDVLAKHDCLVRIPAIYSDLLTDKIKTQNVSFLPFDTLYDAVDMAIVLGGDGTILDVSHYASRANVPVLGINMGHVGYMAELEPNEMNLLDDVLSGNYHIVEHDMLLAEILNDNGSVVNSSIALNDVTVGNGGVTRLIDLELRKNNDKLATIRADGVVISTPTGSTAYSLAAGGPVIDPDVPCFCVTPICPQIPTLKPVVFSSNTVISIHNICYREKHLIVTTDGKNLMTFFTPKVLMRAASMK